MDAVSYLHGMNIVHRDLKPENILLTESNDSTEVKITDFGLAKRTNQEGLKTFCGTPQYFAPEVLKRKSPTDSAGIISSYSHKADVWSIGVITYIMLSGSFPFDDEHLFDQIEHAQYSLGGAEWCSVSSLAKHFIRSLMNLDIEKRLDVHQAINHPWIEQYRLANPSLQKVVPGSMRSSSLSPQHSNAVTHLPLPVEPSVVHAQEFADSKKYGIFAPPGTITPDRSILDGSNYAARNALQEELLILTAESNDELTLHNGFPKPTIFWSSKAALVKLASTKKKVSIKKVLPTVSPAVSTVLQKTVEGAAAHSITPQYDFCPSILNKAMTLSMVRESVTGKAVIDFVEYPDTVLNAVGESLQTEKKKRKRKMASAQSDSKVLSDDDIDSFSDDSNTKIVLPNSAAVTIVRSASKATKRANTITKVVGENSKALKIKKSVPDKVGVSEAICVIENAPLKQLEFVASVPSKLLSRRSTTISSTRRIVAAAANSIQSSRKGIESYFFKKQRVLRSPVPSMSAAFVEHSRQEELPHDIVMN